MQNKQKMMYVLELRCRKHTWRKTKRFTQKDFPGLSYVKTGIYTSHYECVVPERSLNYYLGLCKRKRIDVTYYDQIWQRSTTYRQAFFTNHQGEHFYCRYCGKPLRVDNVTVDHIIPVSKAKKSAIARFLLQHKNHGNVNHISNLCAACNKCNQKKADKMGIWLIKASLGKYRTYHILRKVIPAMFLLILSVVFVYFYM